MDADEMEAAAEQGREDSDCLWKLKEMLWRAVVGRTVVRRAVHCDAMKQPLLRYEQVYLGR